MIHFGDKFLMLLHKARINNRNQFTDRCVDDAIFASKPTAGTYFDRWKARATPPVVKNKDAPLLSVNRLSDFIGSWLKTPADEVSKLLTQDLSVAQFVKHLGIDFNEVRSCLTQPTQDQWDELQGVDPYPRLQFMQAFRQLTTHPNKEQRRDARRNLDGIVGRYYLYRRHSQEDGVLREVVNVLKVFDCFLEGVYYQWDSKKPSVPREIQFNGFYGGTHVACLAAKTDKSDTQIQLTSVQFLLTGQTILRHTGKEPQPYRFYAGMLSGTFDHLDAVMATRALVLYRSPVPMTPISARARVRMLDARKSEHKAFHPYLGARIENGHYSFRQTLTTEWLHQTLWRRTDRSPQPSSPESSD